MMLKRRYTLAKMYGRVGGYEPDSLSDDQFRCSTNPTAVFMSLIQNSPYRRKKQLCEDVLAVLNKIIPGRMRKRGRLAASISLWVEYQLKLVSGMMMYELHLPLVMLANRQLQKGPNTPGINRGEIKDNLKVILMATRSLGVKSTRQPF